MRKSLLFYFWCVSKMSAEVLKYELAEWDKRNPGPLPPRIAKWRERQVKMIMEEERKCRKYRSGSGAWICQ
jgi:hypothetical protein